MEQWHILAQSFEVLPVNARTYNCLRVHAESRGLTVETFTVRDVCALAKKDILHMKNMGVKQFNLLSGILSDMGLSLGTSYPAAPEPEPAPCTIRDQFAMAALTGILGAGEWNNYPMKQQCADAYDYADAMLEARKGPLTCPPSAP